MTALITTTGRLSGDDGRQRSPLDLRRLDPTMPNEPEPPPPREPDRTDDFPNEPEKPPVRPSPQGG